MKKKTQSQGQKDKKKLKKTFLKPVITISAISAIVDEVYGGWSACSPDAHNPSFAGT